MSDLTDYLKIRRNNILLTIGTALLLIFLAFLLIRGCQNSRTRLAETQRMQHVADSLRDRLRASEIAINNTRATYEARMAAARQERAIAAHRADSAGKLLSATQARVKRLLNERIGILEGPMDEPAGCDSCWAVLPVLDAQVTGYREENTALQDLMAYETNLRDSMLIKERLYSDSLLLIAKSFGKLSDRAIKLAKTKNRFYLEGTIGGSHFGLIYGGGINLITKGNKSYGIQIQQFNKQTFYSGRIGLKF